MLLALPLRADHGIGGCSKRFPIVFHGSIDFHDKMVIDK